MAKYTVEFGNPEEREKFINGHERFFERVGTLYEAITTTSIKTNVVLEKNEIVMDVLGALCVEDYNEILLLVGNGYGYGALRTLRSMFEKLVTARYLEIHPDDVYPFWDYHVVKVHKLQLDDVLKKLDPDGAKLDQFKVPRTGGGRKRLQPSWTKIDFVSMANEVGLGEYVKYAYHFTLEFAHPSVTAVLSLLDEIDGQLTILENGPQPKLAEVALMLAHYFLLDVLRLQIDHYKTGNEAILQQCVDDYRYIWGQERPTTDDISYNAPRN